MSTIATMYNITFDVKRMVAGDDRKDVFTAISTGNAGVFRPITDSSQMFQEGSWGKEYKLFCACDIDIKPNDTININDEDYGIAGVSLFEDLFDSSDTHQEIQIYKK